jgi:SWIM zinc finger
MIDRETITRIVENLGGTMLPDTPQWLTRFEIKSTSSGKKYILGQKDDGTLGCSCTGWTRHRKCKHTKAVLEAVHE